MRLSVIVVSYNTSDLLRRCLSSLGEEHEVIVVDNASTDGSQDMVRQEFPQALLIANDRNLGFGAANNLGFSRITGDLALLLNSDAYACPGSISELLTQVEDPTVVACGGRLVNPGGESLTPKSIVEQLVAGRGFRDDPAWLARVVGGRLAEVTQQSSANRLTLWAVFCEQTALEKLFPESRVFSPYWTTRRALLTGMSPIECEQVMGACLLMRPVERFDERFFLYCEDTELCKRLRAHGRILYVPGAVFGHELGGSSLQDRWQAVARYNRGKELYFGIHHGTLQMAVCWLLNRLGAFLRALGAFCGLILTAGLEKRFHAKLGVFWKVLTAPIQGPPRP